MIAYTCGRCPAEWSGITRAHCSGCHETFASVNLFNRHRRYRGELGECLDPAVITVRDEGVERRLMTHRGGLWCDRVARPAAAYRDRDGAPALFESAAP